MNLVLNEGSVVPGKLRSFLAREESFHQILAKQPGVRATILARSLGNPMRFARGGIAENVGAVHAFLESTEFESFFAANPLGGVVTPDRPLELYESVAEAGEAVAGMKPGMHLLIVEWTLDGPAVTGVFEQSRRTLFELRQKHGQGFVRSSMYRFLGSPNRYLIVHTSSSREAGMGGLRAPELQAFQAGHPRSVYASSAPVANEYEVVKVTRPG